MTTGPLAAYKDLCLDAGDPGRAGRFWSAALRLENHPHRDSVVRLSGADPQQTVWINAVPEPKTAKNRVHIDVTCDDLEALLVDGARLLRPRDGDIAWHVLADPEGNEFCVFTS